MKLASKMLAAAALIIGLNAQAEEALRKNVVLDTGKGGLHLVVSVPHFADGPIDFAGNKGPLATDTARTKFREVAFNAQVGETGFIVYKAFVSRRIQTVSGEPAMTTADRLANDLLKTEGFSIDRATRIDSPQPPFPEASIVTYKVSGPPVFDKVNNPSGKAAMVVMAVALPDKMQGYALLTMIGEKDVTAFEANPRKYERMVATGFADFFTATGVGKN